MSVRVIAELGSNHYNQLDRLKKAVDVCATYSMDLKVQLFPDTEAYTKVGNVWLSPANFSAALDYANRNGVVFSASVFSQTYFDYLVQLKPKFIKFAFGKKDQTEQIEAALASGIETIVSCDVMTDNKVPPGSTKLYCIPEYPVRYEIAFDSLFDEKSGVVESHCIDLPARFDGFSDHTIGLRQTKCAIDAGAKIIEKHVKLDETDMGCPDDFFAVPIKELGEFKRRMES